MADSQPSPPALAILHILSTPASHGTRAWQSKAHPSPTAPLLATASSDKSIHIWDLRDWKLLSTIAGGHKRSVRCVGWKDHGSVTGGGSKSKQPVTLATGSFDANVGIWVHNDQHNFNGGEQSAMAGGREADNDELDMTNTERDEEEEWHFSTLLTGPDSEIKGLEFSPPHYSANLLATSSRDKSVWVWEEVEDDEWETIAVLGDHTGDVKCVRWCTGALTRKKKSKTEVESVEGGPDEAAKDGTVVGCREVLASGSYDDTIRLWRDVEEEGDWVCVGVIDGHAGTVWDLCWEGYINYTLYPESTSQQIEDEWEPRIVSCSDDMTVRVWRRELSAAEKEKREAARRNPGENGSFAQRLPSIIRPPSSLETWVEDSRLPDVHVRSVYAIDWSRRSGLVVTCGGDGTIAVYRETLNEADDTADDILMNGTSEHEEQHQRQNQAAKTKWIVVASIEAAHDEYEINHVCWAARRDEEKRFEGEEVLISTGDDGSVRIWTLPAGLVAV